MASGYIEYSDNTGTSVGTGLVKITMTTPTNKEPMPTGGVRWSHLEIVLKHGSVITATVIKEGTYLHWDTNGYYIAAGPLQSDVKLTADMGTYYKAAVITIDVTPSLPGDGASETVYLQIKTDHSTSGNLIRARLYWHELSR